MRTHRILFSASVGILILLLARPAPARADNLEIGQTVKPFVFKDIRYLPRTLKEFGRRDAFVILSTCTRCPHVAAVFGDIGRLEKTYRDRGVEFVGINVNEADSMVQVAAHAIKHGVEFQVGKDVDGLAARALGLTRTAQVAVLDAQGNLWYRGGVEPETLTPLKTVLDGLLADQKTEVEPVAAKGCLIAELNTRQPPRRNVNFSEHVAALMQRHCQDCHRPGTEAPFSLITYEQVAGQAAMIAEVVSEQRMPPWYASPDHGTFVNARGLSADQRETILAWVETGVPKGDPAKAPKTPQHDASKWIIGQPDRILTADEEFTLPAEGYVPYKYVFLPHEFEHDTWVQDVQILPSNPRVVHHCNLYTTDGTTFDGAGFVTGKVPGGVPMQLADGLAFKIPKGTILGLQIHYTTTGKVEKDRISVGLRYARAPVTRRVQPMIVGTYDFEIPPGANGHEVRVSDTFKTDVTGLGLFSHMHLRGKDMTFIAYYPDGRSETLLVVPNYSFDWQLAYVWKPDTVRFPQGTRIECVAHFDNSAFNPYNPAPDKPVRYGPQTYHEMMFGFVFFTDDTEKLNFQVDPKTGRRLERSAQADRLGR